MFEAYYLDSKVKGESLPNDVDFPVWFLLDTRVHVYTIPFSSEISNL